MVDEYTTYKKLDEEKEKEEKAAKEYKPNRRERRAKEKYLRSAKYRRAVRRERKKNISVTEELERMGLVNHE